MNYPPIGDFSFFDNENTSKMVEDAYNSTLSVEGGLDEMKREPINGFMFSTSPIRKKIDAALINTETGGLHSGSSYACTMRHIHSIARLGWENYVNMILTQQSESSQSNNNINVRNIIFHKFDNNKKKSVLEEENVVHVCAICLLDNNDESSYVIESDEQMTIPNDESYVSCGHVFHQLCIETHITKYNKTRCPLCNKNIKACYLLSK